MGTAMTAPQYSVIYRGENPAGFDFTTAKSKLITTFALSEEKAEKILKGSQVVLKKGVDETTARKIGTALLRAGLDIVLVKSRPDSLTEKPGPVKILSTVNQSYRHQGKYPPQMASRLKPRIR